MAVSRSQPTVVEEMIKGCLLFQVILIADEVIKMSKPVKLNELIAEMEMIFGEYTTFYHPKSGEFYYISDQAFAAVEGDESMIRLHDVEDEELSIAGDICENSSDYIELPDRNKGEGSRQVDQFFPSEWITFFLTIALR